MFFSGCVALVLVHTRFPPSLTPPALHGVAAATLPPHTLAFNPCRRTSSHPPTHRSRSGVASHLRSPVLVPLTIPTFGSPLNTGGRALCYTAAACLCIRLRPQPFRYGCSPYSLDLLLLLLIGRSAHGLTHCPSGFPGWMSVALPHTRLTQLHARSFTSSTAPPPNARPSGSQAFSSLRAQLQDPKKSIGKRNLPPLRFCVPSFCAFGGWPVLAHGVPADGCRPSGNLLLLT